MNNTNQTDEILGALVGLARACEGKEPSANTNRILLAALAKAAPGMSISGEEKEELLTLLHREKALLAPDCTACQSPCGKIFDLDLAEIWNGPEGLRSAKFLLLTALCSVGASAFRAMLSDRLDEEVLRYLYDGLFMVGYAFEKEQLFPYLSQAAEMYQKGV